MYKQRVWLTRLYTSQHVCVQANNNTNSYGINLTLDILVAHISKEVLQKVK